VLALQKTREICLTSISTIFHFYSHPRIPRGRTNNLSLVCLYLSLYISFLLFGHFFDTQRQKALQYKSSRKHIICIKSEAVKYSGGILIRVQLCSYLLSKGLGMHCHDYIPCWYFDLREILDSSLDLFQLKCIESVSCFLIEELDSEDNLNKHMD
jgi:hypothetical protein